VEEIVLRKGRDVGRLRGSGEMVLVEFSIIRNWSAVLQCWEMWSGCIEKELCWWCVRSWDNIRIVHWGMRDGSGVAAELYIKTMLLALEGFLFFSLYSFSCIENQVTTLKQLRLLSCLQSLDMHFKRLLSRFDISFQ